MTDQVQATAAPVSSPNPSPAGTPATPDAKAAPATTGTNTASGQETPKEAKVQEAKPELFEMKVNGKTVRMTREDMIRRAQLSEAATERFEQAAAKEKHLNSILAQAKSNPIGMLMDLGLNEVEAQNYFEKWYSERFIEPEALTPEQRELKAAQDKLKRYEQMEKEYAEKTRAEREEQEVATRREILQKQIMEMIEEHKLPKTKHMVSRIAFFMRQAAIKGFDAPMDLIAQQVKEENAYRIQDIPADTDYEGFVSIYGEDIVKRIISEHLKHIRGKRQAVSPAAFTESKPKEQSGGRISMAEADMRLKKLMGRN